MKLFVKLFFVFISYVLFTIGLTFLSESLNLPSELALGQIGPTIGAFIFGFILFRLEYPFKNFLIENKHPSYLVIFIVFLPFILAVIAKALYSYMDDPYPAINTMNNATVWIMFLWIPVGALFEELGFRNYFQRQIRDNTNLKPIMGHTIVGLTWGLWHMQIYQFGIVFVIGQLLMFVGFSILLGDLLRRRGQNIITSVVAHISLDLAVLYLMSSNTYTALTSILYGSIALLFALYYIFNLKKIVKT